MNMGKSLVINYKRISTASQNNERQLYDIECDRVFEDVCSGKDVNRPELEKMLFTLRAGDLINVHELSRLAPNTKDLLELVEQILSKGATVKFYKENLTFSGERVDDAFQKLMLTMLGAISTFERDLLLERQREGIAIAKQKGKYKGRQSQFSDTEIEAIKQQFNEATNKAKLARKLGISRGYLYQMMAAIL
jgi:DNA invertase Pin-like site-specific DNA recombinase